MLGISKSYLAHVEQGDAQFSMDKFRSWRVNTPKLKRCSIERWFQQLSIKGFYARGSLEPLAFCFRLIESGSQKVS